MTAKKTATPRIAAGKPKKAPKAKAPKKTTPARVPAPEPEVPQPETPEAPVQPLETSPAELPQAELLEPGIARAEVSNSDVPAGTVPEPDAALAEPAPAKKGRSAKRAKPDAEAKPKKLSALDAAAKVLEETGQALSCQELIDAMAAKGYWTTPGGKTPSATLYAAILRETKTKGTAARFRKAERGRFERSGGA